MASSISLNQIVKHLNLPLLLSIGIHGLFFMIILPDWNAGSKLGNKNGIQNTPVIEFNDVERTRLPQQKQPRPTFDWNIVNTLPSQNDNPITLNIPNLPPPPSTNSLPLPQIGNGGIVNIPSFPPPPPITVSPPDITPTPIPNNNPTPIPQNPTPIPQPQVYSYNYSSQLPPPPNFEGDDINQPTILDNVPTINDSDLPTYNSQPSPRISLSPEEEAKMRAKIFANSQIQISANPRDVINGRITNPNTNNSNQNNSNQNNSNQNNSNNQTAIVQPLPKNYESLAKKLEKKSENTTNEEARKNYVAWAAKVKNVKSKQVTLQGVYPKDACIRKLEGTTTYGVTVNPAGSVVSSKLIKSSGYGLFNNQALRQIQGRKFANNTGGNQPYHVYVNFNYNKNICPSLSINNLGDVPPAKSPNTTPKTTPSQTNTPTPKQPTTTITPTQPQNTPNQTNTPTQKQPTTTITPVQPKNTPNQTTTPTQKQPTTTIIPVQPKNTPSQTNTQPQTTVAPVKPKPTPKSQTPVKPKQTVTPVKPKPVQPKQTPEATLPNTPQNKANQLVIPQTNSSSTQPKSVIPNLPENQNKPTP